MVLLAAAGLLALHPTVQPDTSLSQRTAVSLTAAVHLADRDAFTGLFDAGTPPQRIETLWRNMGQLTGLEAIGETADSWRIDWRLAGQAAASTHQVRSVWQCSWQRCRLADVVQQPGSPTPVWLTGQITVASAGQVTVLGAADASQWLAAATGALDAISGGATAGLLGEHDPYVIELPADRAGFEQVLAAPASQFATIGAITWQQGANSHIVVNPQTAGGLDDEQRRLLLAHELVHLRTVHLGHPASGQLWVSEGLAEALALPSSPTEQARSLAVLRAGCPLDATPPPDDAFSDPARQQFAYAWSAAMVAELLRTEQSQQTITALWQGSGELPPVGPPVEVCARP